MKLSSRAGTKLFYVYMEFISGEISRVARKKRPELFSYCSELFSLHNMSMRSKFISGNECLHEKMYLRNEFHFALAM